MQGCAFYWLNVVWSSHRQKSVGHFGLPTEIPRAIAGHNWLKEEVIVGPRPKSDAFSGLRLSVRVWPCIFALPAFCCVCLHVHVRSSEKIDGIKPFIIEIAKTGAQNVALSEK